MSLAIEVIQRPAGVLGFGGRSVWIYLHNAGQGAGNPMGKHMQAAIAAAGRVSPVELQIGTFTGVLIERLIPATKSKRPGAPPGFGVTAEERWGDHILCVDPVRRLIGERRVKDGKLQEAHAWVTFAGLIASSDPESLLFE